MSKHTHQHRKNKRERRDRHGHQQGQRRKVAIHHDWRFWVSTAALVLMLLSMSLYVLSLDESLSPSGEMEADAPAAIE